MLKKLLVCLAFFVFAFSSQVQAQTASPRPQEMLKGKILSTGSREFDENGALQKITFKVRLDNNRIISAEYRPSELSKLSLDKGVDVVITKTETPTGSVNLIMDTYRIPSLIYFLVAFVVIAVLIVGRKGVGSLFGLIISLIIILYGIVPLILKGYDPLTVTIMFSLVILLFTTYLAHGVSKQTTVALVSTFISLLLTLGVSYVCIGIMSLNGLGNENVYDLYFATGSAINAKGLLLSGIIIATLGALNDVTVTQAVTLFEMKKLSPHITLVDLIKKGLGIGREHGASMVNTIVLAYAGSSLFVFIFFIVNPQKQPLWAILNNEFMVEEIVKALAGTMGILLSVPIVTILAAWAAEKYVLQRK